MYFINQYKDNYQKLSDKLTKKYTDIYLSLPFENSERKEYVAKANEIRNIFKEKGTKIIKDYFKKLNRKTTDIYAMFVSNLNNYIGDDKSLLQFQSETLKMIKKHKISVGDISALLYMKYLLTNNTISQKNVILNESQYYGELFINVLQIIFPDSGLTIFNRNHEYMSDQDGFEIVNLDIQYDTSNFDIEEIKEPTSKVKQLKNN